MLFPSASKSLTTTLDTALNAVLLPLKFSNEILCCVLLVKTNSKFIWFAIPIALVLLRKSEIDSIVKFLVTEPDESVPKTLSFLVTEESCA